MKDWKFLFQKYVLKQHRPWAEPKVVKALSKIHGDLFIDIGTNRKFYPRLLRNNFKQIITIDANLKWNPDLNLAISNFNGHAQFYIGDNEGSADSLEQNPHILGEDWQNSSKFDVEVSTFDELGLDADLVKIDVEGSEFQVLEGMVKHTPLNVLVELHDERRNMELEDVLAKKFRSLRWIDNTHILASMPKTVNDG